MRITIDIDKINAVLEQINSSERLRKGRALFSSKSYADEPIIRRGAQMANYEPDAVREMRALGRSPEARRWTDARLFVEQGRLMAGYRDDCPYHGTFMCYFPTYDAMSNQQLRGYFTWRTRVRDGLVEETSASFAYVYLYELINGIGVEPGVPAFRAIEAFWRAYRDFEPSMDRYVRPWLVDYVVYHGLDPKLALPYLDLEHGRAVEVLRRAERAALDAEPPSKGRRRTPRSYGEDPAADEALFEALASLSTYHVKGSRLFKDRPDDMRAVVCAVFDRLARYYRGSRTQGLTESLFGTRGPLPHLMFASAVFYPGTRHADEVVELDECCVYRCQGGIWTCDSLHDGGNPSSRLGQYLRATDRQLRCALDYEHPLKDHSDPKYLVGLIDREINDYLAWKREHAPRHIEVDLSKLDQIRSTAAVTCESLLVDEEREQDPQPRPAEAAPAQAEPEPGRPADASPLGLTPDELALLRALLDGEPAPAGASTDLLVDSVNEKLFELLGDTALEFDEGGSPVLIEDYTEDVRALM